MRDRAGRRAVLVAAPLALGLILPVGTQAADPKPAPVKSQGIAVRLRQSTPRAATLGHVVTPGQTLWGIAREHGVSVEALMRANGLTPKSRLRVGQRLSLPLSEIREGSQEPPSLADIVLERPPAMPAVSFVRPVPGPIGSPFGPRGVAWHGGIDLRAERNDPIHAAAAGMVITSGWERAYGHVVKIWHPSDLMTVYAHNLENLAKVGDWVEQGQVIATVGSTGRATAPHLHFEIRLNGRKYNPTFWLPESEARAVSVRDPRSPTATP
jgi:murein DD-endopeptidase MepM/ murein hydrolase activator NlpD